MRARACTRPLAGIVIGEASGVQSCMCAGCCCWSLGFTGPALRASKGRLKTYACFSLEHAGRYGLRASLKAGSLDLALDLVLDLVL